MCLTLLLLFQQDKLDFLVHGTIKGILDCDDSFLVLETIQRLAIDSKDLLPDSQAGSSESSTAIILK